MSTELTVLALSIVLGLFYVLIPAFWRLRENGVKWGAGPRDEAVTQSLVAQRLDRAAKNFLETFPFFAAAILLVHATGHEGSLSALGAWLYLIARILYMPLYAIGSTPWRSLVWAVSLAGLLMVLAALV